MATCVEPLTVSGLLREARTMATRGVGQDEIVARVCSLAGAAGVRVRHDQRDLRAASRAPLRTSEMPLGDAALAAPSTASLTAPVAAATAAPQAAPVAAPQAAPVAAPVATATAAVAPAPTAPAGRHARGGARQKGVSVPYSAVRHLDGTYRLALGRFCENAEEFVRGDMTGRLVLSANRRGGGPRVAPGRGGAFACECNGLVVDARSWRVLAAPPPAFDPRGSAREVDPRLAAGLYDVVHVDDGTIVTLYCWDHPAEGPTWALASSNGYDVSSLRWVGPLTYAEVFADLACRLYPAFVETAGLALDRRPDGTTRLRFARLDPQRCYTVGFRHHNFHPLRLDPERMWQVQSADLAGVAPRVARGVGLPGVPFQVVIDPATLAAAAGGAPLTVDKLRGLGRDAVARAVAFVAAGGAPAPEAAGVVPPLHYGFILRARQPGVPDILVETALLARVRHLAYERAPVGVRDELTAADRLEFNAMRACLTVSDRADFLALFPEWAPRFRAFDEFTANVTRAVVAILRWRASPVPTREPPRETMTARVAAALADHIGSHEAVSPFHAGTPQIVGDWVADPANAFLFVRALAAGERR
jgi:hypothetical protein